MEVETSYDDSFTRYNCLIQRSDDMAEQTIALEQPILSRNERLATELRSGSRARAPMWSTCSRAPDRVRRAPFLPRTSAWRPAGCAAPSSRAISPPTSTPYHEGSRHARHPDQHGRPCHRRGKHDQEAVDAFDHAVGLDNIDVIFIENVGNLVCPVDFDLGENLSIMILRCPRATTSRIKYPGSSSTPAGIAA